MITYEEARRRALETDPEADRCCEWEHAWSFIAKRKRFSLSDPAIFVLKENGEIVNGMRYSMEYPEDRVLKENDL